MFKLLSTATLLVLLCGFALRRQRKLHISLMASAFALDLLAVAAIEAKRGAIHKTLTSHSPLLFVHVTASVLALASYAAMSYLGNQVVNGNERLRPWHRRVAWVFGGSRMTNYATSWML
jgi:hypothetical protein